MNDSLKGVFLSGLVYPGLGQLAQRNYLRGIALVGIVSACLIAIVMNASAQISTLLGTLDPGDAGMDFTTILNEVHLSSGGQDYLLMKSSSALIFCCWVIGIVDSYLSGKREVAQAPVRPRGFAGQAQDNQQEGGPHV